MPANEELKPYKGYNVKTETSENHCNFALAIS